MAPKPISVPRWADVSGTITNPSSGRKDTGYTPGHVPASGEANWLLNLLCQHAAWLDSYESTEHTWTAHQTFDGYIISNAPSTFYDTLTVHGALTLWSTVYFGSTVEFDAVAQHDAQAIFNDGFVTNNTLSTFNAAASFQAATTFDGNAEFNAAVQLDGAVSFTGTSSLSTAVPISYVGANPTATAVSVNKISALHVSKAFAHIVCNGTATTTLLEGLNMNAAPTQSGAIVSVVFKSPMADANYLVVANVNSGGGSSGHDCKIDSQTVNGFDITLTKYDGTFPTLGSSNAWRLVVDVKGRQ